MIELFQEPDRDIDAIVTLMRQEPSLTAEVLRRCNSSFFGSGEAVTDIRQAVFRVGFHEVYQLSVTLFGLRSLQRSSAALRLQAEEFSRHAATTALIAGTVARELGEAEGAAFTCGLLHDLGKFVLANADEDRYVELLRENGSSGASLCAAEKFEFGFDHATVGARLLQRWGLPEQVWSPVLNHHETIWSGPFARLSAVITLANLMVPAIQADPPGTGDPQVSAAHALEFLGIEAAEFQRLDEFARADAKRSQARLAARLG